jgi:Uma2 family endonuclease
LPHEEYNRDVTLPEALKFTYSDYCLLPEDRRYEVIDGDIWGMPSQTPLHQTVLSRLSILMHDFVQERGLGTVLHGPCDILLSPHGIVQPDAFYVSKERRPILEEKFVAGAPDLVIEVLLQESAEHDRVAKAKRYAMFGVRELWLVDPSAKTIEILVNSDDGFRTAALYGEADTVGSRILLGLKFPAAPIFRPI